MLPIVSTILQAFLSNALTSGAKGEGQPGGNVQHRPMMGAQNDDEIMRRKPSLFNSGSPMQQGQLQQLPRY